MKIWGISDTHLANSQANSMSFYGSVWVNHLEQIVQNWNDRVGMDDIVLVGGDITWANRLNTAMKDIRLISRLPGKAKIIIKGNHDGWWREYKEVCSAVPKNVKPLEGNAVKIDGQVICGTMGWLAPNDPCFETLDRGKYRHELEQLRSALEAAKKLEPEKGIHLLLHFPPFTTNGYQNSFFDLIIDYPVVTCTFGHFHLPSEWESVPQGEINGIVFRLTSTDYLNHKPFPVWEASV